MPTYKVIAVGFHGGHLYDPEGKRQTLTTDKPFTKGKKGKNPMPSWLTDMPKESAGVKAKREAREAKQKADDIEKADQDKKDIDDASFLGEGESAEAGSKVETI